MLGVNSLCMLATKANENRINFKIKVEKQKLFNDIVYSDIGAYYIHIDIKRNSTP